MLREKTETSTNPIRRQKSSPVNKDVTDFKNVNCELLRQDLNTAPWSICGIFDDIDVVGPGSICIRA